MKRAMVVIGANYGDEGKGLMVDFLAAGVSGERVVVRFNGGAQAGHTVVTPNGRRHVFSHHGAGTLAGAATYLAKHYVLNPLLYWHEARQLLDLGAAPVVAADPRCYVTTPYDMMVNQAVEDHRADGRHGSVGVGFGETIERNSYPAFQLWKVDLADAKLTAEKVRFIRDRWLPQRLGQLGLPGFPRDDKRLSDEALGRIVESFTAFDRAVLTAGAEFLERKAVIFEGAQGLSLDMDGPNFPHVTRSNTGLKNVVPLASALGLSLDVIYVTRPYLTKHGAGPLIDEYAPDPPIEDATNQEHPYQGRLRFAALDVPALLARVAEDVKLAPDASVSMAMTCLDHVGVDTLATWVSRLGKLRYYSVGPRRDHLAEIVEPIGMRERVYGGRP